MANLLHAAEGWRFSCLFFVYLAGARMTDAGAVKRSTGVKSLPQGGIGFLLGALGVNLMVYISGVPAASNPYCMEPRKPETSGEGASFFISTKTHTNRLFPLSPIRSTHGQFGSGQATGHSAANIAVCED